MAASFDANEASGVDLLAEVVVVKAVVVASVASGLSADDNPGAIIAASFSANEAMGVLSEVASVSKTGFCSGTARSDTKPGPEETIAARGAAAGATAESLGDRSSLEDEGAGFGMALVGLLAIMATGGAGGGTGGGDGLSSIPDLLEGAGLGVGVEAGIASAMTALGCDLELDAKAEAEAEVEVETGAEVEVVDGVVMPVSAFPSAAATEAFNSAFGEGASGALGGAVAATAFEASCFTGSCLTTSCLTASCLTALYLSRSAVDALLGKGLAGAVLLSSEALGAPLIDLDWEEGDLTSGAGAGAAAVLAAEEEDAAGVALRSFSWAWSPLVCDDLMDKDNIESQRLCQDSRGLL